MLLALAKKLLTAAQKAAPESGGVGTLTIMNLYDTPRFGEVDGIGPVRIDGEGNMIGFSPVTKCVDLDHGGETAWIPTELVRGSRLDPFVFGRGKTRVATKTTT